MPSEVTNRVALERSRSGQKNVPGISTRKKRFFDLQVPESRQV